MTPNSWSWTCHFCSAGVSFLERYETGRSRCKSSGCDRIADRANPEQSTCRTRGFEKSKWRRKGAEENALTSDWKDERLPDSCKPALTSTPLRVRAVRGAAGLKSDQ